jgi:aminoglycoside phosphotransferase (APT) family kinase protein
MHAEEVEIDAALVQRLLAAQFPALADRPLTIVEPWGTDNAIWRLGEDLLVRLPRIARAEPQIELESLWLPRLGPHLPIAIPAPIAAGRPGEGYPYRWGVYRWIDGELAGPPTIGDPIAFARDLADVVAHLHAVPADEAPVARNRARPLEQYDASTRTWIERAADLVDADAALAVWEEALAAPPHDGRPVWVHADLEGNCLVRGGRLCGLVDWGSACAGDPAVDVQVVWSPLFTPESRHPFLAELAVDEATVARSRGAAINQACAAISYYLDTYPTIVERSRHKLTQLGVPLRASQ